MQSVDKSQGVRIADLSIEGEVLSEEQVRLLAGGLIAVGGTKVVGGALGCTCEPASSTFCNDTDYLRD